MPLTLAAVADAVKTVCKNEPVRLAYVFGSYAWGVPDKESDIDIAVLADPALTKEERFRLRLDLFEKFARALAFPMEKVDAVILQDVPILLKYNAVVYAGTPVFERDRSERILYQLTVEQEYDDESYYLALEMEAMTDRILSGGLQRPPGVREGDGGVAEGTR